MCLEQAPKTKKYNNSEYSPVRQDKNTEKQSKNNTINRQILAVLYNLVRDEIIKDSPDC